jgi:hypothetical protein
MRLVHQVIKSDLAQLTEWRQDPKLSAAPCGGDYEDHRILYCDAVYSIKYLPDFLRNLLPPSSGCKSANASRGHSKPLPNIYQTTRRRILQTTNF